MKANANPANNNKSETLLSPRSLNRKLKMSIKTHSMMIPTIPAIDWSDISTPPLTFDSLILFYFLT